MTVRKYISTSQETTLTVALTNVATTMTVISAAGLLGSLTPAVGETFTVVIDPDTSQEEIVDVIYPSAPGSNTLTITRGVGVDGTTAIAHSVGAKVRHMATGRDFREANLHIENSTTAHGLTIANVLETTDTDMITNAMLQSNSVTTAKITDLNVTTGKIADSAITSAKIADLTIATGDIADSAITSAKIADLTIATGDIADSAITSAKIADGTIVAGDIADGAVTSAKILNDTIVNADINTSAQIAYGKLNLTNTIVNADINASAAIALSKLATDPLARANHTGTQLAATVSDFDTQVRTSRLDQMAAPTGSVSANSQKITNLATPTSSTDAATKAYADLMIPLTQKGAASGVAELDADGLLPANRLPSLSITTTQVVATQAAMLALTAQTGDVAVRTDLNKTFILTASPATTLANWQELLTPTDAVLSVDGQTGTVSLSSTYATVANAANKLPLAGGTMSGAIAMGANKITGVADPTNAQDAATKNYIDSTVLAPSNLIGVITSVGNATSIASQTGTGSKFVVDTSPTLVTPVLGVATATSINGTTIPTSKTLVATDSTALLVPSQTGNSGKYLTTDGTTSSWGNIATNYVSTAGGSTITNTVTTNNALALVGAASQTANIFSISDATSGGSLSVSADAAQLNMGGYSNSSVILLPRILLQRGRGTYASPSAVQSGDNLFSLDARGYGATGMGSAGIGIRFYAAENYTDTAKGTYMTFGTTAIGSTNFLERMRVTDSGNLGIGTTFIDSRLNISGNAANQASALGAQDIAAVTISNNNGAVLNVKSKILLGHTDNSTFAFSTLASYYAAYNGANDIGTGLILGTQFNAAGGTVERMRIDQSGNVGINNNSPSSFGRLTIGTVNAGSTTDNIIAMYQQAAADNSVLRIAGYVYTGGARTAIDFIQNSATNFQSQIAFSTSDGSTTTERLRIDSSGNVGIGDIPSEALQVSRNGGVSINANRSSTDTGAATFSAQKSRGTISAKTAVASGDNLGVYSINGYDGTTFAGSSRIIGIVDGTVSTGIVPGRMVFQTANSSGNYVERMRIDSAGLVGFGGAASGSMVSIVNNTVGNYGLLVKGAASQTASLMQFQNSAGTSLVLVSATGKVGIGITPTADLHVATGSTSNYGILLKGAYLGLAAGSTNNLMYLADSRGDANDGFRFYQYRDSTAPNQGEWQTSSFRIARNIDGVAPQAEIIFGSSILGFSTAGVDRMRIDSSGNVSIGSTSAATRLSVIGTGTSAAMPSPGTASGFTFIGASTGTYGLLTGVNYSTGDVWMQAQRIDSNPLAYNILLNPSGGKVGIGTSAPNKQLTIVSAASTAMQVSGNSGTTYTDYGHDNDGGYIYQGSDSKPFRIFTGNALRLNITSDGATTINSIADGTTTTASVGAGYMGIPQNSTTTGSYTLVAADAGKHIYSTATRTVTIPSNASVAYPVGTTLTFIAGSGATVTIPITTDTMYLAGAGTTGTRTLAAHGMATAVKVANTTWYISGNGLS